MTEAETRMADDAWGQTVVLHDQRDFGAMATSPHVVEEVRQLRAELPS